MRYARLSAQVELGSTGINTPFADGSGGWGDAIGGALERGDVDALHLYHRVEDASRASGIGMADQSGELTRNERFEMVDNAQQRAFPEPLGP
jgi:hypothetical protein